jgi:hypothetical protein
MEEADEGLYYDEGISAMYRIFSNLIRTLFTVSEGYKIRCGLESLAD